MSTISHRPFVGISAHSLPRQQYVAISWYRQQHSKCKCNGSYCIHILYRRTGHRCTTFVRHSVPLGHKRKGSLHSVYKLPNRINRDVVSRLKQLKVDATSCNAHIRNMSDTDQRIDMTLTNQQTVVISKMQEQTHSVRHRDQLLLLFN